MICDDCGIVGNFRCGYCDAVLCDTCGSAHVCPEFHELCAGENCNNPAHIELQCENCREYFCDVCAREFEAKPNHWITLCTKDEQYELWLADQHGVL